MKLLLTVMCIIISLELTLTFQAKRIITLEESWVCNVKKSCFDCLRLSYCSWCKSDNKCFAKMITPDENCQNTTILYEDFGLNFEENAKCLCSGGELERHCHPPGAMEGAPECSGRGDCVCGRCFCNTIPFPDQPTKTVMGEFCEFDNFSCDGPKCNEGPYSLTGTDDGLDDV